MELRKDSAISIHRELSSRALSMILSAEQPWAGSLEGLAYETTDAHQTARNVAALTLALLHPHWDGQLHWQTPISTEFSSLGAALKTDGELWLRLETI